MRKIRAGLSATGLVFAATISAPSVLAQDNLTPNGIADDRQNAFAFTNANIYQGDGEILRGGTLLIRDGRVVEVRAGGEVGNGFFEIDLGLSLIHISEPTRPY